MTQVPEATTNVTVEEVPVAITEKTSEDDVTEPPGTSDDTTTVENSTEDASKFGCKDLIEIFESKEEQLKKYYMNGHATKVIIVKMQ